MNWEPESMRLPHWCFDMNPEKIICPCYKVTKGDIVKAVEQGASSFKEVKQVTKVSKACGKCKKKAKKLTKKLLEKKEKTEEKKKPENKEE